MADNYPWKKDRVCQIKGCSNKPIESFFCASCLSLRDEKSTFQERISIICEMAIGKFSTMKRPTKKSTEDYYYG